MFEKYALITIMRELFTHPLKRYSVRSLSKATGLSIFACSEHSAELMKSNMLHMEKIGRSYQYRANIDNLLVRQWKIQFFMQDLVSEKFIPTIQKKVKNISSILLYGSVSLGTDDEKSDVDLLVIADTRDKRGVYSIHSVGNRELNIQVYTPMEWRKKAQDDKIFYEHVLNNSIALYGSKPVVL